MQLAEICGFLGKERGKKLQFICRDMWQAYLKVIAKQAAQAIHVLDRFHVMQKMTTSTDRDEEDALKFL